MFIAVVDYAPNCPVHEGWFYSGLRWFLDETAMLNWIKSETRASYFIKEVWDADSHARTEYKINYLKSGHGYIGAEVFNKSVKVAHINQHPYGDDKEWVINMSEQEC